MINRQELQTEWDALLQPQLFRDYCPNGLQVEGLDDSLDVFAVHGVAATLGALLTGLLASKAINPDGADGSLRLLGVQAIGVAVTFLWSGALSWLIFKVVGLVTPLRADQQDEWTGLDMADAGERAYVTSETESSPHAA